MASKRLMTILATVAALALAALGCGGGGDEESLTKAEFVKQGKAICAKEIGEFGDEVDAFEKKNPKANDTAGKRFFTASLLLHFQAQVDQLRDLPAPSGDEDEIEAMLDSLEKGIEVGNEGDPTDYFTDFLATSNQEFFKGAKTAQEYGLIGCMAVL